MNKRCCILTSAAHCIDVDLHINIAKSLLIHIELNISIYEYDSF